MSRYSLATVKQKALIILSCSMVALPASAGPVPDVFGHNADGNVRTLIRPAPSPSLKKEAETPKIGAGTMAMMSDDKPVVKWFENYDRLRAAARPTSNEIVTLNKPMNQDLDRVKEMTRTCAAIAKRYRNLANTLRKLPVQADWSQVKDLRDGQADFYDQEASVYEEMIKPRRPSRTQEEFDATLKTLEDHAAAAKDYGMTLISMDLDLRSVYSVHHDRTIDDLSQYVMGTKKEGIYTPPK